MSRKLIVEIIGDSSSLERAFSRSSKAAGKFNKQLTGQMRITQGALGGIASTLGVTFGAAGLFAGLKGAVDQASSLTEEMSKSKVVFAEAAGAIAAWSTTTSKAFSISQQDALAAASNFGLLFASIGKGDAVTAAMSRDFVELAGDLASFFNVSTDTALEKLRSGLAGEAEPLRQFGVFITEAKVQAEAYGTGLAKAGKKLTEAQKLQARYNIIMRETGPAHRDAARTAGTWANVTRRIGAQLEEFGAKIGTVLLPKLTELADRFSTWLSDTKNQERFANALASALGTVAGAVASIGAIVATVTDAFGGWRNMLVILAGAWVGFKAAGIGAAIAVSTANVVAAGITQRAWQAALISTGWGALAVAAGIAASYTIANWEKVKIWFKQFWKWLEYTANDAALKVVEVFSHIPSKGGQWARDLKEQLKTNMTAIEAEFVALEAAADKAGKNSGVKFADQFQKELEKALAKLPKIKVPKAPAAGTGAGAGTTKTEKGFQLPYRLRLEQAQAEASGVQKRIVEAARHVAAFIRRMLPKLKRQKLLDAYALLGQANAVIAASTKSAADKAKVAADKAKAAAAAAAAAAKEFTVPLALQVAEARAKALGQDPKAVLLKMKQAAQRALKSGRLGLQGQIDAWNTIASVNDQIAGQAKKTDAEWTKFRSVNAKAMPGFAGLSTAEKHAAMTFFSRLGPKQTLPGASSMAFAGGGGMTVSGGIHLHGVQNVAQLENELMKRSKARPHRRRGS